MRNSNARLDLMSIQERMIELNIKRKLKPISETDEPKKGENDNYLKVLLARIDTKYKFKEKLKALNKNFL